MGGKNSKNRKEINRLSGLFHAPANPPPAANCPICGKDFGVNSNEIRANKHYKKCALREKPISKKPSVVAYEVDKLTVLRNNFDSIKVSWTQGFEKIHISRQDFFWDSMQKVLSMNTHQLRSEFQIEFLGEKSQDAGGLTKEWLNLLIQELLSENFNVFQLGHTVDQRYRVTQNSLDPEFYVLSGKVIGKALLENIPINCPLSFVVLKYILDLPLTNEDVKYLDTDVYKAIKFIETNSIEDVIFETFSVADEKGRVFELVPDGRMLPVNDDNKDLYVQLRVEYELFSSISTAIGWIKEGMFSVFPKEFISNLTPEELDLLICGNPFINVYEWKSFTEYRGDFYEQHKVIRWFWESLSEFEQEDLRALLTFVTGTSRVPVGGFQNLKTSRGEPALFTLEPFPYSRGALPRAHTCFNRMDLPYYRSKVELKSALTDVIKNHTFGFGLE